MSKTTTKTKRQVLDTDFTPEEWLEQSVGEVEVDPLASGFGPEFESLRVAARRRIQFEHKFITSLKQLRQSTGLKQRDVASRWGRSQSQVSKVERTPSSVEITTLAGYVSAFGGNITITIEVDGRVYQERVMA
ncbi:MAG: helix-turn-helix domain-containing protein [Acidimicrobiales bacterium]